MYPIIENRSSEKVSIEEIEAFETKFSIKLPEQYKQFFLKYNGAKITDDFKYPTKDDFDSILFVRFLNINTLTEWQYIEESPGEDSIYIENKMLQIGTCNMGNGSLCISYYDNQDNGKLYYIDDVHDDALYF